MPPSPSTPSRSLGSRIVGFGVVSGIGWLLDFAIFTTLVQVGLSPFHANLIGASLAVTWVYFASVRRVFSYHGHFLFGKFACYAVWQVVAITAASWAVDALHHSTGITPLWAKILVTPLTFLANYVFMARLTRTSPAAT